MPGAGTRVDVRFTDERLNGDKGERAFRREPHLTIFGGRYYGLSNETTFGVCQWVQVPERPAPALHTVHATPNATASFDEVAR